MEARQRPRRPQEWERLDNDTWAVRADASGSVPPDTTPPSPISPRHPTATAASTPAGPITRLPPELWLAVLSHLQHDDLAPLRLVNRQLSALALAPCLHRRLDLFPPFALTPVLRRTLPHVHHLSLHLAASPRGWGALASSPHGARGALFADSYAGGLRPPRCSSPHPTTPLRALLALVRPGQLRSLRMPHAAMPWDELAPELARLEGRLDTLDLSGAGLVHSAPRALPARLRDLNLSYNGITRLPRLSALQHVEVLSLRGCFMLPAPEIARLLANLPQSVHTLDLSEMQQVEVGALMELRVVSDTGPSALRCVKLAGIDHLTRADVRALQRHWAERRAACRAHPVQLITPPPSPQAAMISVSPEQRAFVTPAPMMPSTPPTRWLPHATPRRLPPTPPEPAKWLHSDDDVVDIVHTALLESDDEAGYRQFIGEVVGGTLGLGFGGPLAEGAG